MRRGGGKKVRNFADFRNGLHPTGKPLSALKLGDYDKEYSRPIVTNAGYVTQSVRTMSRPMVGLVLTLFFEFAASVTVFKNTINPWDSAKGFV